MRHARICRRGHRGPGAAATQRRFNSPFEPLEPRRLLSVGAADDPALGLVTWNGEETYAMRGQWLAQFDGVTGTPAEQVAAVRERVAAAGLALDVADHLGADGLVLLQAPAEADAAALNDALAAVPGVLFTEPNFVDVAVPGGMESTPVFPDDPSFGLQWALHNTGQTIGGEVGIPDADIDMPEAWDVITGGTGRSENGLPDHSNGQSEVIVAVIDTGVDYNHPDLAASMWRNVEELNGVAGVDDDGNGFIDDVHGYDFIGAGDADPMDDNNHGTHVSGTIGAASNNALGVGGVNWGVKIMALKAFDANARGFYSDVIKALNYATMMSRRGVNVRVTNHSWSGETFSTALRDAIARSGDAGLLCVAAAGNESRDADLLPRYPAAFDLPNIISVANTTNRDSKAPASNWGAKSVDLGAPGRNVLSTIRGGAYALFSGTSMATPHVVGVAALGWGLAPGATYGQIREAIFGGVDPLPALQGITTTGGRLNAYNTLGQLVRGRKAMAAPDEVRAVALCNERITVRFADNSLSDTAFEMQRATAAEGPFETIATLPAYADTFVDQGPFELGQTYSYRVRALGTPNSFYSDVASATTYDGGAVTDSGLTLNGSARFISVPSTSDPDEQALQLTDNVNNQTGSAFLTVGRHLDRDFTTRFTFQMPQVSGNPADGFTFILQGNLPDVVGGGGGGLGSAGVPNSLAVKFDIFQRINRTGVYVNGEMADDGANVGFELDNGHVYLVTIGYDADAAGDNDAVTVRIADQTDPAVVPFQRNFAADHAGRPFDLDAILGGDCGYAGFTGATGGQNAEQNILDWEFDGLEVPLSDAAAPPAATASPAAAVPSAEGPAPAPGGGATSETLDEEDEDELL